MDDDHHHTQKTQQVTFTNSVRGGGGDHHHPGGLMIVHVHGIYKDVITFTTHRIWMGGRPTESPPICESPPPNAASRIYIHTYIDSNFIFTPSQHNTTHRSITAITTYNSELTGCTRAETLSNKRARI